MLMLRPVAIVLVLALLGALPAIAEEDLKGLAATSTEAGL